MDCKPIQPVILPKLKPITKKDKPQEPQVIVINKTILKDTKEIDKFEKQK